LRADRPDDAFFFESKGQSFGEFDGLSWNIGIDDAGDPFSVELARLRFFQPIVEIVEVDFPDGGRFVQNQVSLELQPALDARRPDACGELGFFGHDVTDEALEALFEVVINLHLLGVSNREDLDLVGQLTAPAQFIIEEANEGLVNFVLGLYEQKYAASEGVHLENKAV